MNPIGLIAKINKAAAVDRLRTARPVGSAWCLFLALDRRGRNSKLPRLARIADVADPQAGCQMGDIEYAPAAMPKMGDVEILAAIFFLHGQLEGRLPFKSW